MLRLKVIVLFCNDYGEMEYWNKMSDEVSIVERWNNPMWRGMRKMKMNWLKKATFFPFTMRLVEFDLCVWKASDTTLLFCNVFMWVFGTRGELLKWVGRMAFSLGFVIIIRVWHDKRTTGKGNLCIVRLLN